MVVNNFLDEILEELSYRCDEGIVDLKNKNHIRLLKVILYEKRLYEVADILIENLLLKQEDKFKNPILNKTVKYKDEDNNEKEGLVGNLLRLKKDTPGRDAAERALSGVSDEDRKEINKELGGDEPENQPQNGGDKQPTKGKQPQQQEPQQNVSGPDAYSHAADVKKGKEDIESSDNIPSPFNKDKSVPQKGRLSDADDEFSDGDIKQQGLEIGYREKDGFKPAPGNAGSMLGEIMSGEVFSHLEENPNLTEDELFEKIHEQIEDTELGKQNGSKKKTKTGLLNTTYRKNVRAIARAGITKYKENQKGIDRLESEGKMIKPVKVRNFYGHEKSISQQVKLIESINGPIYTKEGIEVPKEVVIDLIKKSGGGENPSDTSTITIDKDGRALVTFHSDKLSTADIQANSTPNKEYEEFESYIDSSSLNDRQKEQAKRVVREHNNRLAQKEEELKAAANQPAREMSNGNIEQILQNAKSDTNSDGTPSKNPTSSRVQKVHSTRDTNKRIIKYLPDGVDYESATEEQRFKAYLDYMGDDDKEIEPTEDQVKFLYRIASQQGYDISTTLSNIRKESLDIQRNMHKKLNESSVSLPSGKSMPLGDYIEGQNLISKLHLGVMDGEKGKDGVGKYPGLFNLNMGGVLVESEQLKGCLEVDNTDDFIEHFEVGTPDEMDKETINRKTGQVTGRNIFVYAVTKGGKRIPVAFKTQRSKQGESGKLSTTYQWDKGIQNCFKSSQ